MSLIKNINNSLGIKGPISLDPREKQKPVKKSKDSEVFMRNMQKLQLKLSANDIRWQQGIEKFKDELEAFYDPNDFKEMKEYI
jgi:hypothetical protein